MQRDKASIGQLTAQQLSLASNLHYVFFLLLKLHSQSPQTDSGVNVGLNVGHLMPPLAARVTGLSHRGEAVLVDL